MTYTKYLTCDELLSLYPHAKIWGWDTRKIGTFYRCLLIDGKPFGKKQRIQVTERSFVQLINYKTDFDENRQFCNIYMTYDEIMEDVPQAEGYRWSPTVIGVLKSAGLLHGKRLGKESANAITETSVSGLIGFTNQRLENIINL